MRKPLLWIALTSWVVAAVGAQEIPRPAEFLQIDVGADRVLADYRQIRSYFAALDAASPRVQVEDLGPTTLGERMIMAVISSEENIANLDRIREQSRKLADPRGLSDAELATLVENGKSVVLVTCNIHSTEIGSSQMAMEWAWSLATAQDDKRKKWLDDVVLLLVPSLNPDGQIMVTEWYRKYLGTPFEGGPMPWLYHYYVGHDNNRDWFMLTQKETRDLNRAIYHEWFPQIFVDHHQMGSTGPRMFIPPFSDPLDPDIHPLIWREIQLIGSDMAFRLEQADRAGVIYGYAFDAYWMGGTRNTGWWKNITGLLTETASARIATPIEVHPTELDGGRKGLLDYQPQVNHPNPWRGGLWRLRDIMDYQRIASDALLETASLHRRDFLADLVERAKTAIASATRREAYRIPKLQHDWPTARRLARLFADHGVNVYEAKDGDFWIPLDQPYSRFVREMMEPQRYPEVRVGTDEDEILDPYDVSTWSLPLLMGVRVEKTRMPFNLDEKKILAPTLTEESQDTRSEPVALPTRAPFYAIPRNSPESAKVVNAILAAGGEVFVSVEPASDITQAPVPVTLEAGTFYASREHAELGATAAAETAVPLVPVLRLPGRGVVKQRRPRIALYKPAAYPSMDEGWTRFLLDQYAFESTSLGPKEMKEASSLRAKNGLESRFDILILPSIDKDILAEGRPRTGNGRMNYAVPYPPEWEGGLGSEGAEAIRRFVRNGGTLLAFDDSTDWVMSQFQIPVMNVLAGVSRDEFSSPGALLRAHVDQGNPVTWGMPDDVALFQRDSRAFATTVPGAEIDRLIFAWYPEDPRDILLSGWIRGEKKLTRKAAGVAFRFGRGRIVLFGFRPQHRAQTIGTFSFVFNSIYWSSLDLPASPR